MILDLVLFLACLAFFHTSEFALAWIFNPSDLSRDSWLFSRHYCLAMGLALSEYFCERALAPGWKRPSPVMWAGLLLVLLGEALRKAAILTAGPSFTLDVKTHRRPHHHLVTTCSGGRDASSVQVLLKLATMSAVATISW